MSKLMSKENSAPDLSLDIEGILDLLPHRYPFLLVDRLLECDRDQGFAVAQKMVSINEPYPLSSNKEITTKN